VAGRNAVGFFAALLFAAASWAVNVNSAAPAAGRDQIKELVEDECTQCHEFDRVTKQHLSKEEWAGVIKGMVDEGPPLTDPQFAMVVDYLARHYGPQEYAQGRPGDRIDQEAGSDMRRTSDRPAPRGPDTQKESQQKGTQ
jgi:mono/diheme cytochrome c family protein